MPALNIIERIVPAGSCSAKEAAEPAHRGKELRKIGLFQSEMLTLGVAFCRKVGVSMWERG